MGAGKSSVGSVLAGRLGVSFVDLDLQISKQAGKSIPQIFSEEGELTFRNLESASLRSLSDKAPSVVSTGGGVIGRLENRTFMQSHGFVVYLSAEWETLKRRIGDTGGRPLAQSVDDWTATRQLYLDRCPLYKKADLIVSTDHRSILDIVNEISRYAKFKI